MVNVNGIELPDPEKDDLIEGKKTFELMKLIADAEPTESYAETVSKIHPYLEDEDDMSARVFLLFRTLVNLTAIANGKQPEELLDILMSKPTPATPRLGRKGFLKFQEAYYADMKEDETKTLILLLRVCFDLGKRSSALLKTANQKELKLLSQTFGFVFKLGQIKSPVAFRTMKALESLPPYEIRSYFSQQGVVDENFINDTMIGFVANGTQSLMASAKQMKISVPTVIDQLLEGVNRQLEQLS